MKFDLISDVHLDFATEAVDWNWKIPFAYHRTGTKYLFVAGDISTNLCSPNNDFAQIFFEEASKLYEKVVCVLGNHDYWCSAPEYGTFSTMNQYAKERYGSDKIVFLDNESIKLDDTTVLGCTNWTKISPAAEYEVQYGMNDYRYTWKDNIQKINVHDTVDANTLSFAFIRDYVERHKDEKIVILTHHCPTFQSSKMTGYGRSRLNGAYCNSYENFILDNPHIKFWCCGHNHSGHIYDIGTTKVICNPMGYWGHERFARSKNYPGYKVKTFVA